MKQTDIVDLAFMLRAGLYVILKVLPERIRSKVNITTRKAVSDEIGKDIMPDFMGGGNEGLEWTSDPHMRPSTAITVEELGAQIGIDEAGCKKFREAFVAAAKMK